MRAVSPGQACLSAAFTAAAVALVNPTVSFPAAPVPSASLDAAIVKPARTAEQPALTDEQAFARYRATPRRPPAPSPSPSRTVPRVSDHLESARVISAPGPSSPKAPTKAPQAAHAAQPAHHAAYTELASESGAYGSAKAYAESLVGPAQFACLEPLWQRESGWNVHAENPGSGAYGIPQALPGSKMASAGSDWAANGRTQVKWGVGYIDATYESPCAALAHSDADGWY